MATKRMSRGSTGWAGSELARASAGRRALPSLPPCSASTQPTCWASPIFGCMVHASAAAALATPCDVFVEYTKPDSAKANILAALERGAHVVVGTSGLTDADLAEIDVVARRSSEGCSHAATLR